MIYITYITLIIYFVFALFLLYRSKLLQNMYALVTAILLLAGAFAVRIICMDHVTADYSLFLSRWVNFFCNNGGYAALSQPVGNYNLPYLYFLAVFSYFKEYDLYLIKLLSILFDILLAYYAMRIVSLFTAKTAIRLAAFFIILFMPTVILNGAYWGQCDSIFTSFALMSIYFALTNKPTRSIVCIALSFTFKLQVVFIMPVIIIFLFTKKIKLRHLLAFPITYVITVLPAVIIGRPFMETITLYFDQISSVGSGLNYNSSSLYSLVTSVSNETLLENAGIIAAFSFVIILYMIMFIRRKNISDYTLIVVSTLFATAIPMLLPHMHDRYFFMADIFCVIFAIASICTIKKSFWTIIVPFLTSFASLLGYYAYLKAAFLMPMKYGAIALIFAVVLLSGALIISLSGKPDKKEISC